MEKTHSHKSWEFTVFLHALWARHWLEDPFFIPGNINAGCKTLKYNITRFYYSFIVFVVKPPSACKLLTHKYCHKSYILLKIELSCYFNLAPRLQVGFYPREEHSLTCRRKITTLWYLHVFRQCRSSKRTVTLSVKPRCSLDGLCTLSLFFGGQGEGVCALFFFSGTKELSFSLYWPSRGAVLCAQATAFVYRRHKRHIFSTRMERKLKGNHFQILTHFLWFAVRLLHLKIVIPERLFPCV